jgi:ribosomal peptide maturation radical SAM protein 1
MNIALINMPWGALERPALGISLLAEGLRARGHGCELRYLNMPLADRLGAPDYGWVTHELPHIAFAGDWLFTEALYGTDAQRDRWFIDEVLRGQWRMTPAAIKRLLAMRPHVNAFMQAMLDDVAWGGIDLVGFTSTFEQNIASLALARRLKARYPDVLIAFGGANWEGPMGQEYHRAFGFVDFACSGEADITFPALIDIVAKTPPGPQRDKRLAAIAGLVFRNAAGGTVATGGGVPVEAMDTLPVPDYSEYFAARDASPAGSNVSPVLLFEASRGCWWGAKSHCTFCGLNGHSMHYRRKSPPRLLAELEVLIRRWPCPTLEAVDNILDMGYFDSVLPVLEQMDLPGPVFFEVKANLKRHHVAALKRANILRIQPGIESLSDHVLTLMRKGTTALRNVQLLKWCREYGIAVDWNLLYGFPGERDEDYLQIMDLLPRISHLQAPGACGPIRLDRFSPYFEHAQDFGLHAVRALPVYRFLYPLSGLDLDKVAYYFEFAYSAQVAPSAMALKAAQLAEQIRESAGGGLQALPHADGGLHLTDSRLCAQLASLRLTPLQSRIVQRIDEVASLPQVLHAAQSAFPDMPIDEAAVRALLDKLISLNMAISDGSHYLGLALMPVTLRPALESFSRRQRGATNIPIHAARQVHKQAAKPVALKARRSHHAAV